MVMAIFRAVQRLVLVADEMNDEFQRLFARGGWLVAIGQDGGEALDGLDGTVAILAVARRDIGILGQCQALASGRSLRMVSGQLATWSRCSQPSRPSSAWT